MTKRILLILAAAATLGAQSVVTTAAPATPETPRQQKVFVLKYADASHVANVLSVFGYGIRDDRNLHVVAVSAPAPAMAAIEDAIKRLDVPAAAPSDIDLVAYMIVASAQASPGSELPANLQPVADEMRKIFPYKSFHLLDSILLRVEPGNRADARGIVMMPNCNACEREYDFSVNLNSVTDDAKERLIRLDNLELDLHLGGDRTAKIRTDIAAPEGQRVVVGKSNIGPDQALVLVMTAKTTE